MPLPKSVLLKYKSDVFVETGTLGGEAIRLALECGFSSVYSIDIDVQLIEAQRLALAGKPVALFAGSSDKVLDTILPTILGRITFWLDAHPPGNVLTLENTPVRGELKAIDAYVSRLEDPKYYPVIMLDDMRLFTEDARQEIELILGRYPGTVSYEDTPIASRDIMVYSPPSN